MHTVLSIIPQDIRHRTTLTSRCSFYSHIQVSITTRM